MRPPPTSQRKAPDSWENRLPPSLVEELLGEVGGGSSSSVVRQLVEREPLDECLWCMLGEGSVDECVCGNQLCWICALDEEGDCLCGKRGVKYLP